MAGCSDDTTEHSYMYIQNTLSFLLNTDFIWHPGSTWFYNNAANHLNSHVINEIAGMPPKAYAMENLFPQLGINDPYWNEDQDGVIMDLMICI